MTTAEMATHHSSTIVPFDPMRNVTISRGADHPAEKDKSVDFACRRQIARRQLDLHEESTPEVRNRKSAREEFPRRTRRSDSLAEAIEKKKQSKKKKK
jgi:hypothetical protein